MTGRSRAAAADPVERFAATLAGILDRLNLLESAAGLVPAGSITTAKIADANVTDAKISNRVATSVMGRSANSAGVVADIQATADDTLLRRTSSSLSWGTATLGMLPAALSRGILDYAEVTANQGTITTMVDLASLSVTFTAETGRDYLIIGACDFSVDDVNSQFVGWIRTSSTSLVRFGRIRAGVANDATRFFGAYRATPSAGSVTYKLSAERLSGTGDGTMIASATNPAFILALDIGA